MKRININSYISKSGNVKSSLCPDVSYQTQVQNVGWQSAVSNGESAGTAGYAYRLEAIQIVLVPKGGNAPGSTANAFRKK